MATSRSDVPLAWRPSVLAGRLAAVAVLAAVAALVTTRVELLVLAAPCLMALLAGRRSRLSLLSVEARVEPARCVEGDEVSVSLTVPGSNAVPAGLGGFQAALDVPDAIWELASPRLRLLTDAGDGTLATPGGPTWTVTPHRWGRRTLGPVTLEVHGPSRMQVARQSVDLGQVEVLPPAALAQRLPLPPRLLERVGLHAGRVEGHGVEFAGVRTYEPGDVIRRIHWPATARRSRLHLTRFAAERSADVVVLIDATTDLEGSLDYAVRGGAGIAEAYLRAGDRVGVVALGGMLRWLPSGVGARQLFRMAETVLDVRHDDSYVIPELTRLPRTALPPGALVFALTPLLDARVLEVLRDLRERGHPTVIVDVLRTDPDPPPGTRAGAEAVRLWRLERDALRHELATIGIAVVPWGDDDRAIGLLDRVVPRLDPRGARR